MYIVDGRFGDSSQDTADVTVGGIIKIDSGAIFDATTGTVKCGGLINRGTFTSN